MTAQQLFQVADLGSRALSVAVAIALTLLPYPRQLFVRGAIAILVTWAISVFYAGLVYNPLGLAAASAQGIHAPWMRYDNNTIAAQLLAGWVFPAISVLGVCFVRHVICRFRRVKLKSET
ncbi:hypothetical protein [Luteimonas panaciterrae]|uniref:hypothetical protein n=1 Tax=Luteimonas panaciterrae TaxID=363885 RepID=UPI001CF9DB20|nr:hypothetical protein [Luteimonas panaciterrae]